MKTFVKLPLRILKLGTLWSYFVCFLEREIYLRLKNLFSINLNVIWKREKNLSTKDELLIGDFLSQLPNRKNINKAVEEDWKYLEPILDEEKSNQSLLSNESKKLKLSGTISNITSLYDRIADFIINNSLKKAIAVIDSYFGKISWEIKDVFPIKMLLELITTYSQQEVLELLVNNSPVEVFKFLHKSPPEKLFPLFVSKSPEKLLDLLIIASQNKILKLLINNNSPEEFLKCLTIDSQREILEFLETESSSKVLELFIANSQDRVLELFIEYSPENSIDILTHEVSSKILESLVPTNLKLLRHLVSEKKSFNHSIPIFENKLFSSIMKNYEQIIHTNEKSLKPLIYLGILSNQGFSELKKDSSVIHGIEKLQKTLDWDLLIGLSENTSLECLQVNQNRLSMIYLFSDNDTISNDYCNELLEYIQRMKVRSTFIILDNINDFRVNKRLKQINIPFTFLKATDFNSEKMMEFLGEFWSILNSGSTVEESLELAAIKSNSRLEFPLLNTSSKKISKTEKTVELSDVTVSENGLISKANIQSLESKIKNISSQTDVIVRWGEESQDNLESKEISSPDKEKAIEKSDDSVSLVIKPEHLKNSFRLID